MKITREEMKSYINKLSNDIAVNKQLSLELKQTQNIKIQPCFHEFHSFENDDVLAPS